LRLLALGLLTETLAALSTEFSFELRQELVFFLLGVVQNQLFQDFGPHDEPLVARGGAFELLQAA
jgi:hypothetical protein